MKCERVALEAEPAGDSAQGLMACGQCRDFVGLICEEAAGSTRVVAVHCFNCATEVPVRAGYVLWRPPFLYRLRSRLARLISPV